MKKKLVVLTGAGISAESGIKTFRDSDGLWEGYDVMEVASPQGWRKNPALVLDFYNQRRKNAAEAKPNAAHTSLAALEEDFDVTIITQNIDDLHERGGSTKVIHLHGEIFKMRSDKSLSPSYEIRGDIHMGDLAPDGGQLRPDIVWFGEAVPKITEAIHIAAQADIFVVAGTSMAVYPAAGLIDVVPAHHPKFVIDRRIPAIRPMQHLTAIEKPATLGVQELQQILKEKIFMTGRHLFVPLETDPEFYYASCNIVNDDSLVYVYLLHPQRGSLLFTLHFDEKEMQYKPRFIVPGLDQLTLLKLNEHLVSEASNAAPNNNSNNYHIHINKESYGYIVINRLYKKTAEGIQHTGKFHVFYEQWHELKAFEWDAQSNAVTAGDDPGTDVYKLISKITREMDQQ